ncbi:hypothetical protein NL676_012047 [Syzygium grande]|nr:hypothetical protein NL676_012047 [Syzygium grande]
MGRGYQQPCTQVYIAHARLLAEKIVRGAGSLGGPQHLRLRQQQWDGEDVSTFLIFPLMLWRMLRNQIWTTLSRDDRILFNGLTFYIGAITLAEASCLLVWRSDGVITTILLHVRPVEFLYYWLHRALHHHYLYSRYHFLHHSSIVTKMMIDTDLRGAGSLGGPQHLRLRQQQWDGEDVSTFLIFPLMLWRMLRNQIWTTLSRDDRILFNGLTFYIGAITLAEASCLLVWRSDGVITTILLHVRPVEFLYYWLHRALHHHYLYSRYHFLHHSSIVTKMMIDTDLRGAGSLGGPQHLRLRQQQWDGEDVSTFLIFPLMLWRMLRNQIWTTLSRDDQILFNGLTFYIGAMTLAEASCLPVWRSDGVITTILLHVRPVEFLYYWLHRALHHHYLYSRYHFLHHSSIVTEMMIDTDCT